MKHCLRFCLLRTFVLTTNKHTYQDTNQHSQLAGTSIQNLQRYTININNHTTEMVSSHLGSTFFNFARAKLDELFLSSRAIHVHMQISIPLSLKNV